MSDPFLRRILARHKQRKYLATGIKELSWLSVCASKWHFMTSLAKNMLGFSPSWASKSKTRFQQATKMKRIIGILFWPIREKHQQQQRSSGISSAARWVTLKLEKPSKIPHIYMYLFLLKFKFKTNFSKSELKFPITNVNSSNLRENFHTWQHCQEGKCELRQWTPLLML